jgi:hypothetical protein
MGLADEILQFSGSHPLGEGYIGHELSQSFVRKCSNLCGYPRVLGIECMPFPKTREYMRKFVAFSGFWKGKAYHLSLVIRTAPKIENDLTKCEQ